MTEKAWTPPYLDSGELVIMDACGCFRNATMNVFWPCSLHRGAEPTEEERQAEQQLIQDEADAWQRWIDGRPA